jgi:hypothetical protein
MSVAQRYTMTEDEAVRLHEVGNEFWEAFSKLCAEQIMKMPPDLRAITCEMMQEKASVYGSKYEDYVDGDHKPPTISELIAHVGLDPSHLED